MIIDQIGEKYGTHLNTINWRYVCISANDKQRWKTKLKSEFIKTNHLFSVQFRWAESILVPNRKRICWIIWIVDTLLTVKIVGHSRSHGKPLTKLEEFTLSFGRRRSYRRKSWANFTACSVRTKNTVLALKLKSAISRQEIPCKEPLTICVHKVIEWVFKRVRKRNRSP